MIKKTILASIVLFSSQNIMAIDFGNLFGSSESTDKVKETTESAEKVQDSIIDNVGTVEKPALIDNANEVTTDAVKDSEVIKSVSEAKETINDINTVKEQATGAVDSIKNTSITEKAKSVASEGAKGAVNGAVGGLQSGSVTQGATKGAVEGVKSGLQF